jgi:biopolymer transport protein ExbB/TolQ
MNDTYQLLGELSAKTTILLQTQEKILQQNSELQESLYEMHHRVKDLEESIEQHIMPEILDYNSLKQRGIGVLSVVGVVCAVIGLFAEKLFSKLFG